MTIIHTSVAVGAGATPATSAVTTSTGLDIWLAVGWFKGSGLATAPTSVTGKIGGVADGNTYSLVGSVADSVVNAGQVKFAIYHCPGATGGPSGGASAGGASHVFTVTFPASQDQSSIWLVALPAGSVVDQTTAGIADGASPYTSNNATTTQASETLIAFTTTATSGGTELLAWGNSFASLGDALGNAALLTGDTAVRTVAATGTYQSSFTSTGAGTTEGLTFLVTVQNPGSGALGTLTELSPPTARRPQPKPFVDRSTGFEALEAAVPIVLAKEGWMSPEPSRPAPAKRFPAPSAGVEASPLPPPVVLATLDWSVPAVVGAAPKPYRPESPLHLSRLRRDAHQWSSSMPTGAVVRPSVADQPFAFPPISQVQPALAPLDWSPPAQPRAPVPSRPADQAFVGEAIGATPFSSWPQDPQRAAAPPRPAVDAPYVGAPLQSSFPFASWPDAPRNVPRVNAPPQADQAGSFPRTAAPPPGEFQSWSVDTPPSWKQPQRRAEVTPTVTDISLPAATPLLDWSPPATRSSIVSSRKAEPQAFVGPFIAPPVLAALPWSQDPPRAPRAPTRAPDQPTALPALAPATGLPWAPQEAGRGRAATARPAESAQPFPAIAAGNFAYWVQDAFRQQPRPAARDAGQDPGNLLSTPLAAFDWSSSARAGAVVARPAAQQDLVLPAQGMVASLRALDWSSAMLSRAAMQARADQVPVFPSVVPPLPGLDWFVPATRSNQARYRQAEPPQFLGPFMAPLSPAEMPFEWASPFPPRYVPIVHLYIDDQAQVLSMVVVAVLGPIDPEPMVAETLVEPAFAVSYVEEMSAATIVLKASE